MKLTIEELNLIKEIIAKSAFPGNLARTVADLSEKIDDELKHGPDDNDTDAGE